MSDYTQSEFEQQLVKQVAALRELAVKSIDPLIVAKAVAASDQGVQQLILARLGAGERLVEVFAFQNATRPEVQVFFRFQSPKEIVHLLDTGVLAFVDSIKGEMIGTVDPFILQPERCVGRPFVTVAALQASAVAFAASKKPLVDRAKRTLEVAEVKKGEVVYDLGSGDGRIVIAAAKAFGCRAVGVELDELLVERSRAQAKEAGVEKQASFQHADLFETDFTDADVVALYLLPEMNKRLIPKLDRLRPGARVVTLYFPIPGVTPVKVVQMTSQEDDLERRLYLYTVPLKKESTMLPIENGQRTRK
jgi:SAM-dependent methyltransferase